MKINDRVCLAHFLFPDGANSGTEMNVLHAASAAERVCRLKYSEGEIVQDVCLYVHKGRASVSSLREDDAYTYELKKPADVRRACFYLLNCRDRKETVEPDTKALFLSKTRYEELKEKAGSVTLYVLAECLTAETGDLVQSAQLARVLKNRSANGELLLCSKSDDSWSFQQAGYIEDAGGGWLLRMSCAKGEDWMTAVQATKAQLCAAFYQWISQR